VGIDLMGPSGERYLEAADDGRRRDQAAGRKGRAEE